MTGEIEKQHVAYANIVTTHRTSQRTSTMAKILQWAHMHMSLWDRFEEESWYCMIGCLQNWMKLVVIPRGIPLNARNIRVCSSLKINSSPLKNDEFFPEDHSPLQGETVPNFRGVSCSISASPIHWAVSLCHWIGTYEDGPPKPCTDSANG